MHDFSFHEITRLDDELLPAWLDLYETSFPPSERLLVSEFIHHLRAQPGKDQDGRHMIAAVDQERQLIAMAYYEILVDGEVGAGWYLAVVPELRNQGIGTAVYKEMMRRMSEAGCLVHIFEVEIPELAESAEERLLAERRISFYRRLGALMLRGIHYLQSVGPHQQPIPMHLMAHLIRPLDAGEVFRLARGVFGDSLSQTGPLSLE